MKKIIFSVSIILLLILPIKEILCQSSNKSNWYIELWGNSYYSVGKEFSNKTMGARIGLGLWPQSKGGGTYDSGFVIPFYIHTKFKIGRKTLQTGVGYSYVKNFFEKEDLTDVSNNSFFIVSIDYPLLISKKGVLHIGLNYSHAKTNPKRYSTFPGFHIRYSFIKADD